ncbi:hypothetical protein ACLB2K_036586 [Fragaria x ananassa]
MLAGWKSHEGKEMEVFELFRLFTSEVICRTAFGSSYLEGENIVQNIMKLSVFLVKNSFTVRFPGLSKFVKTNDEIESENIEKGIRAHRGTNDKERISVDDLVDEWKTFYFSGQETTNNWQDKARKEVMQIFGKQTPDPDGLTKLKTICMIMNESLRLYPPVLSIEQKVNWEVKLGKFSIPANVDVHIPTLALHHEPLFWGQDAQLFKPERFSEGVSKANNNNVGSFLPFGMGPRICAGFNFASIEAKIVLSMVLQRYSFTLSPGYVHSPHQFHTIRPQHGVQVLLYPL